MPHSGGKFAPNWSPDGQLIVAPATGNSSINVFEIKAQRWMQIYKGLNAYGHWSRDSRFIYFLRFASDRPCFAYPSRAVSHSS